MAGYDGYSMSNNAREAYEDGYMPKSKWTKASMIEAIKTYIEDNLDEDEWNHFSFDKLNDLTKEIMFQTFFIYKEWHHTSSKYNRTDFYGIDKYNVKNMTNDMLSQLIEEGKKARAEKSNHKESKSKNPQGMYLCEFKHWTGTKKHPKCEIVQAVGEIKGKMFYSTKYGNKRLSTDGFRIINEVGEESKETPIAEEHFKEENSNYQNVPLKTLAGIDELCFSDKNKSGYSYIYSCLFSRSGIEESNYDTYLEFMKNLVLKSIDTDDFVSKYLDKDTALQYGYYKGRGYQAMLKEYRHNSVWYYIRENFGEKCKKLSSYSGCLKIGCHGTHMFVGFDEKIRYAVLKVDEFYSWELMKQSGMIEGNEINIYAGGFSEEIEETLPNGKYCIYYYSGLVAIVSY